MTAKFGKSALASLIGALVGPILCTTVAVFIWPHLLIGDGAKGLDHEIYQLSSWILSNTAVLFVGGTIVGLPLQAQMQKRNLTKYHYHLPFALLGGFIWGFLWNKLIGLGFSWSLPLYFAAVCFVSTTVSWLIRRPDHDDKPIISVF